MPCPFVSLVCFVVPTAFSRLMALTARATEAQVRQIEDALLEWLEIRRPV
jgi:hypothetical protein